ncbi:MAG: hypothetical protein ACREEB_11360 [Caulobacteraceae bacterium]
MSEGKRNSKNASTRLKASAFKVIVPLSRRSENLAVDDSAGGPSTSEKAGDFPDKTISSTAGIALVYLTKTQVVLILSMDASGTYSSKIVFSSQATAANNYTNAATPGSGLQFTSQLLDAKLNVIFQWVIPIFSIECSYSNYPLYAEEKMSPSIFNAAGAFGLYFSGGNWFSC